MITTNMTIIATTNHTIHGGFTAEVTTAVAAGAVVWVESAAPLAGRAQLSC